MAISALILNVGTTNPLTLDCTKAAKLPPLVVGQVTNAFAGNERNATRRELQRHAYTTSPVDDATRDAVERLCALSAVIPVTGALFRGFVVSCAILVTAEAIPGLVDGSAFPMYTLTLAVREV